MRVIEQLIDHFRSTDFMTSELEKRLTELGLIVVELDDDAYCECCGARWKQCQCGCHSYEDRYEDSREEDWLPQDIVRRRKVSWRLRGKRGRRREATVDDVRLALGKQFEKWQLPGGRLDHLVNVGSLLSRCGTWRKAATVLISYPAGRLVEELGRRQRYSVRPLFNRLDDFDLALRSFAGPWRGQAGAALRRLVDVRPDRRRRRLLKYTEFQDVAGLVEMAGHLRQARRICVQQTRQRQRNRGRRLSAS